MDPNHPVICTSCLFSRRRIRDGLLSYSILSCSSSSLAISHVIIQIVCLVFDYFKDLVDAIPALLTCLVGIDFIKPAYIIDTNANNSILFARERRDGMKIHQIDCLHHFEFIHVFLKHMVWTLLHPEIAADQRIQYFTHLCHLHSRSSITCAQ